MEYSLENLTPDKFQKLCQSLIAKEVPDVQCFPVGQADGGRDAISFFFKNTKKDFVIYQMKFVRNPSEVQKPRTWLVKVLKEEMPRIAEQIPKGAKKYYLITNIAGSAFSDSGSIDQVQVLLKKNVPIPSMCWWRDDINRRLDEAWDLKWVYPEILTGPDIIRFIIQHGLEEDSTRRTNAVRAFLQNQYSLDRQVKFKQIELQNELLDLFVDVPVKPFDTPTDPSQVNGFNFIFTEIYRTISKPLSNEDLDLGNDDSAFSAYGSQINSRNYIPRRHVINAADFLLHPLTQEYANLAVIEGAPGQGKSTIGQYVCQVHRIRILDKHDELNLLPLNHAECPLRLPIKIDIRDLSTWLSGRNPFLPDMPQIPSQEYIRTLEAFLAALIKNNSGGMDFNVSDLVSVLKITSLFLFFDGLDEVADIVKRKDVVDEIVNGIERLKANIASIQAVITSRPVAFGSLPGFPEDKFIHLHLDSLSRSHINKYSENWLKARTLGERECQDVRKILKEKLDQPHLRDLARNPMQLTILLSLIHTRGASLPDKRTALYDAYMELFFNRESEKSIVVREHRDLLINIHRFLAWKLHSDAELHNTRGSITEKDLLSSLETYLKGEGYDPILARQLFAGMIERVVALVSRIQGTYEFEVQPLREYFAARYLYDTAPYSPVGSEKSGTKPDRFDAIAMNFYWLNVTRFFAGCYSTGELASLIYGLKRLIEKEYPCTSYPKVLATTLLSDWVFSQSPRLTSEVVKLILENKGIFRLLNSASDIYVSPNLFVLPSQCGNREFLQECFESLSSTQSDYLLSISQFIRSNANLDTAISYWKEYLFKTKRDDRIQWMEKGLYLGVLEAIDLDEIANSLTDNQQTENKFIEILLGTTRFNYLESDPVKYNKALNIILNREMDQYRVAPMTEFSILGFIHLILHGFQFSRSLMIRSENIPFSGVLNRHLGMNDYSPKENDFKAYLSKDYFRASVEFVRAFITESERSCNEWSTKIDPWDNFIEKGRTLFGDRWTFYYLANIAAGIKSKTEKFGDFDDIFNHHLSLCKRVRYARLRSGAPAWWKKQFARTNIEEEKIFLLLILISWGTIGTLTTLASDIDPIIKKLSDQNWHRLFEAIESTIDTNTSDNISYKFELSMLNYDLNERTVALFGLRLSENNKLVLYSRYLAEFGGNDEKILQISQFVRLHDLLYPEKQGEYRAALSYIEYTYRNGIVPDFWVPEKLRITGKPEDILTPEIAKLVGSKPGVYPFVLSFLAEQTCKSIDSSKVTSVIALAKYQKWFDI